MGRRVAAVNGGENMYAIIVCGMADEIATLALAVQERRQKNMEPIKVTPEALAKAVSEAIHDKPGED